MARVASGESLGESAQSVHYALPRETGSAGMGDPSDFPRPSGTPGQERDLAVGDDPAARDRAHDGMDPIAECEGLDPQLGWGTRGGKSAGNSARVRMRGVTSG